MLPLRGLADRAGAARIWLAGGPGGSLGRAEVAGAAAPAGSSRLRSTGLRAIKAASQTGSAQKTGAADMSAAVSAAPTR